MKTRFRVGKRDIRKGECGDATMCAVALSVTRRLHQLGAHRVAVSVTNVIEYRNVRKNGIRGRSLGKSALPEIASEFIDRFDESRQVKPFSFGVVLPKRVAARLS